MEKAEGEYRKYQVKTLSSVEKAYIETLKELKKIEKKNALGIVGPARKGCSEARA